MKSDFLLIGKVAKPHGLRGQVKVLSYASSNDFFFAGRKIYWGNGEEKTALVVSEAKVQPQSFLLHFQGLDTRQQAEAMSGSSLYLKTADLEPLPEGEYYWHQLIGSRVYNDQGRFVGLVEEIFSTAAHDVWVIRKETKEILVPAVEDFIVSVDLDQGEIRVRDIEDFSGEDDQGNDH
jgi:16S rRNA processing protein RimM